MYTADLEICHPFKICLCITWETNFQLNWDHLRLYYRIKYLMCPHLHTSSIESRLCLSSINMGGVVFKLWPWDQSSERMSEALRPTLAQGRNYHTTRALQLVGWQHNCHTQRGLSTTAAPLSWEEVTWLLLFGWVWHRQQLPDYSAHDGCDFPH